VTEDQFAGWLDAYGRAWEARDVEEFVGLFAEDAVYYWSPWTESLRGRAEIRPRVRAAVSPQVDVRFGHEPLALTPDGRCTEFRERWSSRTVPLR
jgi:hypothetical protein